MSSMTLSPYGLINEVMKIVIFKMLEFSPRRRKKLLTEFHMGIHRTADIEKYEDFDRIMSLGNHFNI